MIKRRLDAEMVRRGMVPSREAARRLIVERQVLVGGSFADKPARMVATDQAITLAAPPPPFVSRAGQKLAGALEVFAVDPSGLYCLDAGSSTGGFTDCLLQRGAERVVAVDVGTNQLHERLRVDPRVDVREQTDIRSISPSDIDRPFDLVVGDLSFISLRLVLPSLAQLVASGGRLLLLVKPQFEAGRQEVSRGKGVITDPDLWRTTVADVLFSAIEVGLTPCGLVPSSIRGTRGNVEFVVWLINQPSTISGSPDVEALVDTAVAQACVAVRQEAEDR